MAARKQPARDEKGRILPKTVALRVPPPEEATSNAADSQPLEIAPPPPSVPELVEVVVEPFPGRCVTVNGDELRCLYETHDESFDHVFQTAKKEPVLHGSVREPKAAVPARRATEAAWWCGVCDNSQPPRYSSCLKCGTDRA